MIRRSTLIALEVVLALIAALAIGAGIAWWRLSQGPIELGFLRGQIQAELSAARDGRPVGLEQVRLSWAPRGALELRAVGVTIEDGGGNILSRSEEARIEVAVLPLLIGRVHIVRADFEGGAITITRKADGAVHIAFGPEGASPDLVIPPPPPNETLEQRVARLLDGLSEAFRPIGPGGSLRGISLGNAALAVVDEGGGGRWTASGANLQLERRARSLELVADARLEGAEGTAPARLRLSTDTRFQSALIEFSTEEARPRALFSPAALGPFAGLDAPLTATVTVGLDRASGVNRFEGEARLGSGSADVGGERVRIEGGRFHGRYDLQGDELVIDELTLGGDRTRLRGDIRVRDVSAIMRAAPGEPANFRVSLPAMTLEVPSAFPQPIALSDVEVSGAVAAGERTITLTQLRARSGDGLVSASGRVYWAPSGADRRMRPGIVLTGAVEGALDARSVIAMWPIGLGEASRDYVVGALESGRVTNARIQLDIRPSDVAAGVYRNEAVDVRFDVEGGSFRFADTMSPVTEVRGQALLRGNSFELVAQQARLNNLAISNARVELPRFKPRGAMATITGRVEGEVRRFLEVLQQEPINMRDRLPVDVATATGRGAMNVRIQRPMVREAAREDWRFSIDGELRDFAGTMTTRRIALSQGQLRVTGDQRAVTVSGPLRAGASQIQDARWTEHLQQGSRAGYSEYMIAGVFDADDLERLGYTIAHYAEGRVGVTVTGRGRGFDVDNADIEVDVTDAAVQSPWNFWRKRAGQAASARFTVQRQADGGLAFNAIDARGAGLLAQGAVRLDRSNQLAALDFSRLVIEGSSDARISGARGADGGLDVNVRGALFDAAPFMAPAEGPNGGAAEREPSPPLRASVVVDRLKMRGGATLNNARVSLNTNRGVLQTLAVEGRTPTNQQFELSLGPQPNDPRGRVRFRSGDAGFAVAALTGSENVVGGTASADGDWRSGASSSARFSVRLDDVRVVRLPAMARLLSSAGSLRGLVDSLNGDGIAFSVMEAQMTYANDRLAFSEGAMRGPSLGLTASGAYNIERDNLDVDGVVAPSPTLNLSMLGEIPVLGNLIVSRRGEGVFGMTYSINGPAATPRVGVNPVSALTPGILRRIFEPLPQREEEPPSASEPAVTPPASDQSGSTRGDAEPPHESQETAALPY